MKKYKITYTTDTSINNVMIVEALSKIAAITILLTDFPNVNDFKVEEVNKND